jgi:hypothetical protein
MVSLQERLSLYLFKQILSPQTKASLVSCSQAYRTATTMKCADLLEGNNK